MNLQYSGEPGSSLELEETAPTLEKLRHPKRIPVKCRQRNRFIPAFLMCFGTWHTWTSPTWT